MLVVDLLLPGWLDMEEVDILTTRDLTRPYTVQVTTNYNLTHGSHILLPSLIPGQYSYSAHGPRYIQLLAQLRPSRNMLAGIYTPEYIQGAVQCHPSTIRAVPANNVSMHEREKESKNEEQTDRQEDALQLPNAAVVIFTASAGLLCPPA